MNISNIEKVYSGKPGCMCGCKGTYSYNEGIEHEDWQGKVSIRNVKRIANKVFNDPSAEINAEYGESRTPTRVYVVFFK